MAPEQAPLTKDTYMLTLQGTNVAVLPRNSWEEERIFIQRFQQLRDVSLKDLDGVISVQIWGHHLAMCFHKGASLIQAGTEASVICISAGSKGPLPS